jgi:flagellar hook protein FlgE
MGFSIALSGLESTSQAIDSVSNNIANSQTTGYKAGVYQFADEFYAAQNPMDPNRSGMGASGATARDMSYGTVTSDDNPLNVALEGNGMFVVAQDANNNVPTQTPNTFQYTRDGSFGVNANNQIVNESGMYVVGYPASADGKSILTSQFAVLTLSQDPMPAVQTSASTIAMNLNNTGSPIQATFSPSQTNSYTQTTSQTVYDADGNQHTLATYYVKQNPQTLYFYPQNGGTNQSSATIFSFNPNQDTSSASANFSATQNTTSVPNGVTSATEIATTATPATGAPVTNETLSGVTLTAYPAGQNSTYQMTLSNGTTLMVTAQYTTNSSGNTIVRYGYAADQYTTYATLDGINVNRSIATTSQVGQGYTPSSSLVGTATSSSGVTGADASGNPYTIALSGGGTATVTVTGATTILSITLSGGSGYAAGQTITIPAGSLGAGSSAVTLNALTQANIGGVLDASVTGLTTSPSAGTAPADGTYPFATNIPGTLANGTSGTVACTGSVTITGGKLVSYSLSNPAGTSVPTSPFNVNAVIGGATYPLSIGATNFLQTAVSNVSVGGALAGSAAAGNYTIGSTTINGGLSGTLTSPATVAGLGGVAGTYTVALQSVSGTGTGGVATINYAGNGSITGIQISGGQNYASGNTVSIPAGSLGAGSAALTLGTIGSGNVVSGTQLTLSNGTGTPIASPQTIIAGSAGGTQTFSFSNGITFTLNTPLGDTAAGIAQGLNGKVITVANNSIGTMAFVAGQNIDALQTDALGNPAYTTQMNISTTVGSATAVNQLAIDITSTGMTAYSSAQSTYTNTQNGNPQSQLTAYSIDNSGILQATYANGETLMKGQLVIANFNNDAGLIPTGNNTYQMSGTTGVQSGSAVYGTANSSGLGAIKDQALESSNVDLTQSLVQLMTLQRQYSANSQAVKLEAGTMVDDVIQMSQGA